jgi:predicted RNase H-like HicB family nuclease
MIWRVVLEQDPETGEYAVWCPELPGCVSAGVTEDQAKLNIREAIQLFLEETPLELDSSAHIYQIAV